MSNDYAKYEGYIPRSDHPKWGQSYYYNFYDPTSRTGALIRIGIQENAGESNTWLIVFRDGLPIFTRTNMNLPYTRERPATGLAIAGMRVTAEVPLKTTRIEIATPDFSMNLVWNELHPLEDCIAMSADEDGSFAKELANMHLEGTSTVTGHIVNRGERVEIRGKGYRDIAAGPRNWDALLTYRLAWPIFDNGMAFAGVHGISNAGQSAYLRMFNDGKQWRQIKRIDDKHVWADSRLSVASACWKFTDDLDRNFEFTAKPIFHWLFPLDTFVLCEQIMEYRLKDGTPGYGLYETGYRLPWKGFEK